MEAWGAGIKAKEGQDGGHSAKQMGGGAKKVTSTGERREDVYKERRA